ncbi:MAG TPA: hypothetical protein PKD53_15080, partial [Chloroflexaceae bacterium]|nr:hypothetical protein [Chloroflexaceae bacterium]
MTHQSPHTWLVRPPALALLALMALLATLAPLGATSLVGAAPGCPADKSHLVPWKGGRWFL